MDSERRDSNCSTLSCRHLAWWGHRQVGTTSLSAVDCNREQTKNLGFLLWRRCCFSMQECLFSTSHTFFYCARSLITTVDSVWRAPAAIEVLLKRKRLVSARRLYDCAIFTRLSLTFFCWESKGFTQISPSSLVFFKFREEEIQASLGWRTMVYLMHPLKMSWLFYKSDYYKLEVSSFYR